jgi:hypothetical protein
MCAPVTGGTDLEAVPPLPGSQSPGRCTAVSSPSPDRWAPETVRVAACPPAHPADQTSPDGPRARRHLARYISAEIAPHAKRAHKDRPARTCTETPASSVARSPDKCEADSCQLGPPCCGAVRCAVMGRVGVRWQVASGNVPARCSAAGTSGLRPCHAPRAGVRRAIEGA